MQRERLDRQEPALQALPSHRRMDHRSPERESRGRQEPQGLPEPHRRPASLQPVRRTDHRLPEQLELAWQERRGSPEPRRRRMGRHRPEPLGPEALPEQHLQPACPLRELQTDHPQPGREQGLPVPEWPEHQLAHRTDRLLPEQARPV